MISILFFLISTLMLLTLPVSSVAIHWQEQGTWHYWLTILTHMFGHAGWGHLLGNYMFLFPYGLYLEYKRGQARFVSCWFISGLGSLLLHRIMVGGDYGGLIGASGAISGILAASLLSVDENKWHRVAAASVLGYRLYGEIMNGLYGYGFIAYWGHVGGMVSGALLAGLWFWQDGGFARAKYALFERIEAFRIWVSKLRELLRRRD